MKLILQATLFIGLLALCPATAPVRWCTTSDPEQAKCLNLKECLKSEFPHLNCVRRADPHDCIRAIKDSEADAVSLDGGHIYDAGLSPNSLKPVAAEVYHGDGKETTTGYYAVAVVRKGTVTSLAGLKGKKSCHTGFGRSAGWNIPVAKLIECRCIDWMGPETEPVEKPIAKFFSAGCVPGIPPTEQNLCRLCSGTGANKCSRNDPYAGYSGAFQCLKDGVGEVAFVKDRTVLDLPPEEKNQYELLCPCSGTKSIEEYKSCYMAKIPAHAVMARTTDGRAEEIWQLLNAAQKQAAKGQCQVFGSPQGKDLMFKDSAIKFKKVPDLMDAQLYLGKYYNDIQNLRVARPDTDTPNKIKWCAVGKNEESKCDMWSGLSNNTIGCAAADTTEGCIIKILKGEADALTLDGGHIYVAGECGLLPVMAEVYKDSAVCSDRTTPRKVPESYFAVAVVKKTDTDINWNNLKGKKSCHTGVGRTAGWNIPMGLIYNKTHSCEFDKFFQEGCAPGSPDNSTLCNLCIGEFKHKCKPNSNEPYYGYSGAVRCLIEKGNIGFVKHTSIDEVTEGPNKPSWIGTKTKNDFEILCLDGTRRPVSEYATCNLAQVRTHAVVTPPEHANIVRQIVHAQQDLFGSSGSLKDIFHMFQSPTKDSLFKDGTLCLASTKEKETYKEYLGDGYLAAVAGLNKCSPSELLQVCTFHKDE
ncbi:serotransferrin [Hemicordylus capensis]|uniref:serotransferrin n=1 Tax=Hemicordylus capensis TaxID=884348 RepID=UPI002302D4A7|nr:serotransferrin [Hemicordylus capensis]